MTRLLKKAETRGQDAPNKMEELNSGDEQQGGNEYYDKVMERSKQKKEKRKAIANAAGREMQADEVLRAGDKRGITYVIEKNKGLTPRRKKEVRNPRVKKRKKFDEKQKKLGSIRQVYRGGEGRGGYGGELTGIKANMVKSTKL